MGSVAYILKGTQEFIPQGDCKFMYYAPSKGMCMIHKLVYK